MQPARQRVLPCFVDVFDLMVTSYGCLDVRLARMASNVQPNCGTLLTLTLVLKATLRLLGGVQRQQRLWCAPFCIHNCTHELKRCVRGLTRFDSHRAVQHAAREIARAERTRCGRDRGSGGVLFNSRCRCTLAVQLQMSLQGWERSFESAVRRNAFPCSTAVQPTAVSVLCSSAWRFGVV